MMTRRLMEVDKEVAAECDAMMNLLAKRKR